MRSAALIRSALHRVPPLAASRLLGTRRRTPMFHYVIARAARLCGSAAVGAHRGTMKPVYLAWTGVLHRRAATPSRADTTRANSEQHAQTTHTRNNSSNHFG